MDRLSWLIRNDSERERMLDMEARIEPVRNVGFAIMLTALIVCASWLNWWAVFPTLFAIAFFAVADRRVTHAPRPEFWLIGAWMGSELMIASSAALTGGPTSPLLAGLGIPIVTLSARFPLRGVVAGVTFAVLLACAVALGVDAQAVIDSPPLLVVPVAIILSIAVLSTALMRSDFQHRTNAVIDQLTGMLNRGALASRASELEQQSRVTGQPIGLIVGDIDHFKNFNDDFGHAVGDIVLKEVAYAIRKHLRAFDLAYRLGGEEFLVLLPGAAAEDAATLAETLRLAISRLEVSERHVTMSFGVAASRNKEPFDYADVFGRADEALYEAKRAGRDRVVSAPREEFASGQITALRA
ncbi:MAG: diguanylate cyclase [Solirubrobacterales bacterium]